MASKKESALCFTLTEIFSGRFRTEWKGNLEPTETRRHVRRNIRCSIQTEMAGLSDE